MDRKVFAYVTRVEDGQKQALVFRHPDPEAGFQVVKGHIDPGETPAQALKRELAEESGLKDASIVRELATDEWRDEDGKLIERHFFELHADEPADGWAKQAEGGGKDEGKVFHFVWISRPDEVDLYPGHGDYLGQVFAGGG